MAEAPSSATMAQISAVDQLACNSAVSTLPAIISSASTINVLRGLRIRSATAPQAMRPITPASCDTDSATPAHRMSLVFSVKQTGVPAGGMLAGALVPGMALALGWQGALLAVAALCVACVALAQPLRAPLDADRQPGLGLALGALVAPIRMVFGHRPLMVLAAVSALFSAVQVSTTAYMVTYLNESLGMTLLAAGVVRASRCELAGVIGP